MKKFLAVAVFVLGFAAPATGQISIPYTFKSGDTILASEVNANFAVLASNALNRTGGTITGNITVDPGITIDGVDISNFLLATGHIRANTLGSAASPAFAPSDDPDTGIFFGTGALSLSLGGTERFKLDSNGLTVYGVNIINSSGKIPSLTSTYFASLDGSAITNIPETSIVDGNILARLAADEIITGTWRFTATPTALSLTPTWNDAGTTFRGLDINVTDLASASGSKLLDARVGGTSVFSVDPSGNVSTVTFQMTTGAVNGYVLTSDASGNATWQALPGGVSGVPSGMVAMFESSCPAGWTLRSGAGQPYQNKFVRGGASYSEAGGGSDTHVHSVDPAATMTSSAGSHSHVVDPSPQSTSTDGSHSHDPETPSSETTSAGAHSHSVNFGSVETGPPNNTWGAAGPGGEFVATGGHTHNVDIGSTNTSSDGSHTHTINWPRTSTDGAHSHTFDLPLTGSSSDGAHQHSVDITSFNTAPASNVPAYIQVVFCRKD